MKRLITFVTALFLMPGAALADAQSYSCSYGEMKRRVEILSEPGQSVPCEVHYYKDTEAPGEQQVLWSAQNEEGYCERKAEEFVAMLTSNGWSCESSMGGLAPPEPAQQPEAPVLESAEAEEPAGEMEMEAPEQAEQPEPPTGLSSDSS